MTKTAEEIDGDPEIEDEDLEEIVLRIQDGFTSGRVDCDGGKKISWTLTTEVWKD